MSRAYFALGFFLVACSSSAPIDNRTDLAPASPSDAAIAGDLAENLRPASTDLLLPAAADNVAPLIIDDGPPGTDSYDVPFVSVTLCVPGTTTCQTIDHVSVDTGSSGLRIISSLLSGLQLPQAMDAAGNPLAECYQFDDGYTWGAVRLADVKLAGEVAANIPIQLIGDSQFPTVPGDCSQSGPSENTVLDFGSNGIIGMNQIVPDCGDYCSDPMNIGTGAYYSCGAGGCIAAAVPDAQQVPNPVAFFAKDNNGAIVVFPDVAPAGAASLDGALIFGIGTAPNNALGGASVLTVDDNGDFTTVYKGKRLDNSFLDSGTNLLSFDDSSIKQCTGDDSGFYCPALTLGLTAQNIGLNGVSTTIAFSVANTDMLFSNPDYWVYDNLAGPAGDSTSFDWGAPFFLGRSVFIAVDGAATPGGSGPYFAY